MSLPKFVPPIVLDQYDDGGALFRAELGSDPPGDLLKTAADLASTRRYAADYALSFEGPHGVEHRFPTVDAGNTLISAMYFEKTAAALPTTVRTQTSQRLRAALDGFGFKTSEGFDKTAASEVDVLSYNTEQEGTSLEALFGVGAADDPFEMVRDEFSGLSPRGKQRFAMTIKTAGLELPPELEDYASTTLGSDVDAAIDLRMLHVGAEQHPAMRELKKTAAACDPAELVSFLEEFDASNGLTHLYGRRLPDPIMSVHSTVLRKTAMLKEATAVVAGREYAAQDISAFAKAQATQLSDTFGADLASELAARPVETLQSLPEPHQRAIARMMA